MFNLFNTINVMLVTMALNLSSWKDTVPVLIFGMIGIFIVIGVIILVTYGLNKLFSRNKKDKGNK